MLGRAQTTMYVNPMRAANTIEMRRAPGQPDTYQQSCPCDCCEGVIKTNNNLLIDVAAVGLGIPTTAGELLVASLGLGSLGATPFSLPEFQLPDLEQLGMPGSNAIPKPRAVAPQTGALARQLTDGCEWYQSPLGGACSFDPAKAALGLFLAPVSPVMAALGLIPWSSPLVKIGTGLWLFLWFANSKTVNLKNWGK